MRPVVQVAGAPRRAPRRVSPAGLWYSFRPPETSGRFSNPSGGTGERAAGGDPTVMPFSGLLSKLGPKAGGAAAGTRARLPARRRHAADDWSPNNSRATPRLPVEPARPSICLVQLLRPRFLDPRSLPEHYHSDTLTTSQRLRRRALALLAPRPQPPRPSSSTLARRRRLASWSNFALRRAQAHSPSTARAKSSTSVRAITRRERTVLSSTRDIRSVFGGARPEGAFSSPPENAPPHGRLSARTLNFLSATR